MHADDTLLHKEITVCVCVWVRGVWGHLTFCGLNVGIRNRETECESEIEIEIEVSRKVKKGG